MVLSLPSPMKITEIAFTCIPVRSLGVSRAFYEGVLGLKAGQAWVEGDQGFVEYEIGAHTLAIGCGAHMPPPSAEGTGVALEVADFAGAVAELKKANATFTMEPMEGSLCHLAIFKDPDGNLLTLHKRKAG